MLVYYLNLVLVFINKFILKVSKEKKSVITIVVMMLFSYVLIALRYSGDFSCQTTHWCSYFHYIAFR